MTTLPTVGSFTEDAGSHLTTIAFSGWRLSTIGLFSFLQKSKSILVCVQVKVEFGVRTSILTIAAKKKCEMVGQLTNDSGQTTSSSSKVNVRWTWQPSAIAWLYLRGLASELVPQDPNDQGLYGCSNTLCVTNFRTHMVGNDLWYVPISWTNSYREIMFTTP